MATDRPVLTQRGRQRLERELDELRNRRRPEVLARLREALEDAHGDTAHSSEYAEAKRDQAFVEGRIGELERVLAEAEVLEVSPTPGVVSAGSTVVVRDEHGEERYTLVGPFEADPRQGLISIESPVGSALVGRRAGEVIEVDTPAGRQRLQVIAVE